MALIAVVSSDQYALDCLPGGGHQTQEQPARPERGASYRESLFMISERSFSPAPGSVVEVRRFVSQHLPAGAPAHDIVLVGSELASNAIVHARTPFDVTIVADGVIRLEVTDRSTAVPVKIDSPDGRGRGLNVVDTIATRWGVEVSPTGKKIWVEIAFQE